MDPEERLTAIRDIMHDEVFDNDKVDRINDILNTDITLADLAAAEENSYRLGYHAGRSSIFTAALVWGIVYIIGGVVLGTML